MNGPSSLNSHTLFTSESVADGHPDKICDQVSDAILDASLTLDPYARVAVETAVKDHQVVLLGEISQGAKPKNVEEIVHGVLSEIGHGEGLWGLDLAKLDISDYLGEQASEISNAVEADGVDFGAGDQGMMFGYACRETPELMPLPVALAHSLMQRQREIRLSEMGRSLGPDAKSQVTAVYKNGYPVGLDTIVLSTQHSPKIGQGDLNELVRESIVGPVLEEYGFGLPSRLFVNPSGSFTVGGAVADAGLTGRKIIVDTYGGAGRHGGGAFSGKDATKVDRSGAYAARQLAKTVVASGLADRCECRLAYAIGRPEPVELSLETFGTTELPQDEILRRVNPEGVDAFRPARIIERLQLRRPIFQATAAFGHFGRREFSWEN